MPYNWISHEEKDFILSTKASEPPERGKTDLTSLEDSVTQVEDLVGVLRRSIDKRTLVMISLAFLWMIIFFVIGSNEEGGITSILEQLSQVKAELVVLGIIVSMFGLCLDAIAWRILLRSMDVSASLNETLETYFVSFAWGLLVPSLTAAEIYVRISMGKKRFQNAQENRSPSSGELFSSIVLHKLLGFLAFIPLSLPVAYGLVVLLDFDAATGFAFIAFIVALTVLLIAFLALIYVNPNIATGLLTRLISTTAALFPPYRKKMASHKAAARQFVLDYTTNLRILASHPRPTSKAFLLSLLNAMCGFTGAIILVVAAGGNTPILVIFVIMFVSGSINLIPLGVPGMEGLKETVNASLFRKYESFSTAAVISLLISFNTFYVPVLIGIALAILGGAKKGKTEPDYQGT